MSNTLELYTDVMPVGCPHTHRETGAPCLKQYEHGGEHRFTREHKADRLLPKREELILVCSKCGGSIPYRGFIDPNEDRGHPQHRCVGHEIRPFDEVKQKCETSS